MKINDLLTEAPRVEPGSRNPMDLKVADIRAQVQQLEDVRYSVQSFANRSHPDIPELRELIDKWEQEYDRLIDAEIEKIKLNANQDVINGIPKRLALLLNGITKNCTQIIEAYKATDRFLYRGTRQSEDAFYGRPFAQRKPKDSNSTTDTLFNLAMAKAGFAARRDNSIFAGNYDHASGFGNKVYIVFPRDGFKFSWSDNIKDLVLSSSEHLPKMMDRTKMLEIYDVIFSDSSIKQKFLEFGGSMYEDDRSSVGYSDGFLGGIRITKHIAAIKQLVDNNIIDKKYAPYTELEYYINADNVVKEFGLHNNDNLIGAIKTGYEVTISGDYYAIAADHEPLIRQYFGMTKNLSQNTPYN